MSGLVGASDSLILRRLIFWLNVSAFSATLLEKSRSSFQKKLEKVILAQSARKTKGADKRAATIADML
jgi:hypothetical protein